MIIYFTPALCACVLLFVWSTLQSFWALPRVSSMCPMRSKKQASSEYLFSCDISFFSVWLATAVRRCAASSEAKRENVGDTRGGGGCSSRAPIISVTFDGVGARTKTRLSMGASWFWRKAVLEQLSNRRTSFRAILYTFIVLRTSRCIIRVTHTAFVFPSQMCGKGIDAINR